jgi:hypothetical protein
MTKEIAARPPAVPGHRPTTPCLPGPARVLITGRSRAIFRDDGAGVVLLGTRDNWRVPDHVAPADLDAVRTGLALYADALRPAEKEPQGEEKVKARISGTYAHFPVQNRNQGLWTIVFGDYWRSMRRYPLWAIFEACEEWVDTKEWAPKLSELRQMVEAKISDLKRDADRLQAILDKHDPAPEDHDRDNRSGYGAAKGRLPSLRRIE